MELLSTPRFTTRTSKSTSKVPRAIHSLLNSHSSLLRKRLNHFHHHPSSQNVDESPNEKKSVASVKGMMGVIGTANLRGWEAGLEDDREESGWDRRRAWLRSYMDRMAVPQPTSRTTLSLKRCLFCTMAFMYDRVRTSSFCRSLFVSSPARVQLEGQT